MNTLPIQPTPAVSAIILDGDSVLLVKRGEEPNKGLWSLPGGSVHLGETLRDALSREVLEETGLEVEVGEVAGAHDVITRDGDTVVFHYAIVTFRARVISSQLKPGTDAADARWVKLSEVGALPVTEGLMVGPLGVEPRTNRL